MTGEEIIRYEQSMRSMAAQMERMMKRLEEMLCVVENKQLDLNARKEKTVSLQKELRSTLLTQKKAAEMIGVSSATLSRIRDNGLIKARMVGKCWRYSAEDVAEYKRRYLNV